MVEVDKDQNACKVVALANRTSASSTNMPRRLSWPQPLSRRLPGVSEESKFISDNALPDSSPHTPILRAYSWPDKLQSICDNSDVSTEPPPDSEESTMCDHAARNSGRAAAGWRSEMGQRTRGWDSYMAGMPHSGAAEVPRCSRTQEKDGEQIEANSPTKRRWKKAAAPDESREAEKPVETEKTATISQKRRSSWPIACGVRGLLRASEDSSGNKDSHTHSGPIMRRTQSLGWCEKLAQSACDISDASTEPPESEELLMDMAPHLLLFPVAAICAWQPEIEDGPPRWLVRFLRPRSGSGQGSLSDVAVGCTEKTQEQIEREVAAARKKWKKIAQHDVVQEDEKDGDWILQKKQAVQGEEKDGDWVSHKKPAPQGTKQSHHGEQPNAKVYAENKVSYQADVSHTDAPAAPAENSVFTSGGVAEVSDKTRERDLLRSSERFEPRREQRHDARRGEQDAEKSEMLRDQRYDQRRGEQETEKNSLRYSDRPEPHREHIHDQRRGEYDPEKDGLRQSDRSELRRDQRHDHRRGEHDAEKDSLRRSDRSELRREQRHDQRRGEQDAEKESLRQPDRSDPRSEQRHDQLHGEHEVDRDSLRQSDRSELRRDQRHDQRRGEQDAEKESLRQPDHSDPRWDQRHDQPRGEHEVDRDSLRQSDRSELRPDQRHDQRHDQRRGDNDAEKESVRQSDQLRREQRPDQRRGEQEVRRDVRSGHRQDVRHSGWHDQRMDDRQVQRDDGSHRYPHYDGRLDSRDAGQERDRRHDQHSGSVRYDTGQRHDKDSRDSMHRGSNDHRDRLYDRQRRHEKPSQKPSPVPEHGKPQVHETRNNNFPIPRNPNEGRPSERPLATAAAKPPGVFVGVGQPAAPVRLKAPPGVHLGPHPAAVGSLERQENQ